MKSVIAFLTSFWILTFPAYTQDFRGTFIGQVTDASGAVIPNATITVEHRDTSVSTSTKANSQGAYTVAYLSPGVYQVTASATGFKTAVRDAVELRVSETLRLNFRMEVGTVREQVTVSDTAPLLDTATGSGGTVLDGAKVQELPLNGRQVYMLMQLTPGVQFTQTQFGASGFSGTRGWDVNNKYSINGGVVGQNQFLLNGAPISWGGLWLLAPNVDAVQEFKVMTNTYDAQYGQAAGGTVNTTLRSGANAFHGTAFDYLRNARLDANTFTNNLNGTKSGRHVMNQFGGTFSGPIRRNKTFFLGSFEGFREVMPFPVLSSTVPPYMRPRADGSVDLAQYPLKVYDPLTATCVRTDAQGNCSQYARSPFAGNAIPGSRISPIGLKILNLYPLPNTAGCASGNATRANCPDVSNFSSNNLGAINYNQPMARIDHVFDDNNRMYGVFTMQRGNALRNSNGFPPPAATGAPMYGRRNTVNVILDATHVFSPAMVGDFRASFGRYMNYAGHGDANTGLTAGSLGIKMPAIPTTPVQTAPNISVANYATVVGNDTIINVYNYWDVSPNVTHTHGRSTLHYGVQYRAYQFADKGVGNARGTFTFGTPFTQQNPFTAASDGSGLASLLLGYPTAGAVQHKETLMDSWHYYGAYIQDDYRATSTLTLNLGLRWDVQTSPVERYDRMNAGFCFTCVNPVDAQINRKQFPNVPQLLGGLLFAGVGGQPRGPYNTYLSQWQPRAGFAWAVTPRTVIRGGGGLFYGFGSETGDLTGFTATTSYVNSLDGGVTPNPQAPLSNPYPNGIQTPTGASLGLATQLGFGAAFDQPTRRLPRQWQFSFGIQRLLPARTVLDVKYVGSRTRNLALATQWDYIPETQRALGQANPGYLNNLVPNPFYGVLPASSALAASATLPAWRLMVPYPGFNGVNEQTNPAGKVRYDGLQVQVEKRAFEGSWTGGMTFILAYTYSKEFQKAFLNNGATGSDPAPVWNLLDTDRTHIFNFSGVWTLPFGAGQRLASGARGVPGAIVSGWNLDWVYQASSGYPTPWPDADFSCGSYTVPNPTFAQWFNNTASCYKARPQYSLRNVPLRFPWIRNPWPVNVDLSLRKRFKLTEGMNLQFRAEAFNATNTPRFPAPNTNFQQPARVVNGIPTGLGTVAPNQQNFPRCFELSLKLLF